MRRAGWLSHVVAAANIVGVAGRKITSRELWTALRQTDTYAAFEQGKPPPLFTSTSVAILHYRDAKGEHREKVQIDDDAGLVMRVHDQTGQHLVGFLTDFSSTSLVREKMAEEHPEVLDLDHEKALMSERQRPSVFHIPYLTASGASAFYRTIRDALEKSEVPSTGHVWQCDLRQSGGYDGSFSVLIFSGDHFETQRGYSDWTRFPARIRAAATALRDSGKSGRFGITHKDGTLTVAMDGFGASATEMRLEDAFHAEMEQVFWKIGEPTGYWPNYFLRTVRERGGLSTARDLLKPGIAVSKGFLKLKELDRLDASIEALVLEEKWRTLFSDAELEEATRRLGEHGYQVGGDHSGVGKDQPDTEWKDEELLAAAAAYLEMWEKEKQGLAYSKDQYNETLKAGALYGCSEGSVEYQMQNISATLDEIGQQWIPGYQPHRNVASHVKQRLLQILADIAPAEFTQFLASAQEEEVRARTNTLLTRGNFKKPSGVEQPKRIASATSSYERSPLVRAFVLREAAGVCELCLLDAPFCGDDGVPFLEVHHVKPLGDGGSDTVDNAVALCPNCHRRLHLSRDRDQARAILGQQVKRLYAPTYEESE